MTLQITNILIPLFAFLIMITVTVYSWQRSRIVAAIVVMWFIVALFLAQIPFFQSPDIWMDGDEYGYNAFSAVFVIPVVALFVALWRSEEFSKFMRDTPSWVLAVVQVWRIAGMSLLIFYAQGLLPAQIGLSNGIQDVLIGLIALPIAWLLFNEFPWGHGIAIGWNILGLVDFISASVFISLSFYGVMELSPVPTRMGLYPLSLILVFQVPLFSFIHIYLLQRLIRNDSKTLDTLN